MRRDAESWRKEVESFRSSGLSFHAYCRRQKVKPSTFRYWVIKYSDRDDTNGTFVELTGNSERVETSELVFPNGCIIRVSKCFDRVQLKQLIELLLC